MHFDRSWVDFDAKKAPTWVQNRIPNGPKTMLKINQKKIRFLIEFWNSQEATALIGRSAGGATSGGGDLPKKAIS